MIRNPNDIQEGAKKIRMLIAGYPGIGKSTLALSAPNPLHIDVDFGIDRIEPRYRKPYIQPQSYDEILGDLTPINLQDFDTLVFDTGGKLISLMSLWAIKKDPKYGQRDVNWSSCSLHIKSSSGVLAESSIDSPTSSIGTMLDEGMAFFCSPRLIIEINLLSTTTDI